MSKQKFINLIKDAAIEGHKKYSVLPSLTIAQAILETGWGEHSIGNNIFGIKADSRWKGKVKKVTTHEYVNGKKIYVDAYFRDYGSVYESLEDRFKFLLAPRYSKVIQSKDYRTACIEIQKAGYATDPNYSSKLISIIEQNKLYGYDEVNSDPPSAWAKAGWDWAKSKGILDGSRPKDALTREELAVILERLVI